MRIPYDSFERGLLNPDGFEMTRGGCRYRAGDKVMQIRNNYDKEVFNGDLGIITNIDTENYHVRVDVDSFLHKCYTGVTYNGIETEL
jgi:ATP-dependent exoDNAse (exonuclease V) alpha subunit